MNLQTNAHICLNSSFGGHTVAVVTHLPPKSEVCDSNPRPYMGNLVIELPANGQQFIVQSLDQLYVLVSFAHKTIHRDMTHTVLQVTLKPNPICLLITS